MRVRGRRAAQSIAGTDPEAGAVTAETAVVLPVLVLVLVLAVWAVGAAVAQLTLVDAARSAARAVARGEPISSVRAAALAAAPRGAVVDVRPGEDVVHVQVSVTVDAPGPMGRLLPDLPLRATAVAADESWLSG
ncbi:MAG: TadE family type IV pilus minor pilin [Candidatus Nanopelagicales bacterium]